MSASGEDVPRTRLVRGPDGRWQAERPAAPPTHPAGPAPTTDPDATEAAGSPPPRQPAGRLIRGVDGRWVLAPLAGRQPGSPAPAPARPPQHPAPPSDTGPIVRRLAVRPASGGEDRYVVVLGDSGQPSDHLRGELHRVVGTDRLAIDGIPLQDGLMVAQLALADGALVTPVDDPGDPVEPPGPPPERVGDPDVLARSGPVLRVVGGPDAGRVIPLPAGRTTIGRSRRNSVQLRDPSVSRSHVVLQPTADGVVMADLGSENGARVEGRPEDHVLLAPGDLVRLGDTLLELGAADDTELVTLEPGHGFAGVHRRFRTGLDEPPDRVRYPRKDQPGDPPALNLLLAILPAGGIAAMALLFGRPEMLVFAAMSPLLSVARTLSGRRTHRQKLARAELDFQAALARFDQDLQRVRAAERRYRRRQVPDPARIVEAAMQPTTELWSRRATDGDALTLRVGSAWGGSDIRVDGRPDDRIEGPDPAALQDPPPEVDRLDEAQPWLPVGVSLPELHGLALVGALERLRPLACSLVLQAAVLHAPSELQVVFLGGADAEAAWSWLRWLPHVRRSRLEPSLMLGTDPSSRAARVEELRRVLVQRREEAGGRPAVFTPRILVVHDDASARLGEGVAEILREGGPLGIHALALDTLQVPEGCRASLVIADRQDAARVDREGRPPVRGVITDGLDPARCEVVARRLAALRVVGEDEDDGLPTSCRLLGTVGVEPTPEHVRARWAARSPTPRAVIGVGAERPVSLDLTRDGPHALVAGTTGAGKSEFIKTWVASLALDNHPDDLAFLFIDFKGGGDYQTLRRLPHTVALTTNLDDPSAFDRALQLLEAEMGRRVGLLQAVGTTSIEGYAAAARAAGDDDRHRPQPLPRLVVVVDEFAELKDKAPQQLDRLVSVARTGRAVGVHLVLATQRPGGVVTSQIDANVGLRVCFRVKDELESKEIIGSPLAGRIAERHRGRCFFRSAATPLTEAQTARVAGARPGAVSAEPIRAIELGWEGLGRPLPTGPEAGEVPDGDTDLHDVVEATVSAASATGWAGGTIPWPAELSDHLRRSELPAPADPDTIAVALVDVPAMQRQDVLGVALGHGHVVIAGSGRTGRTTALRTFLVGAATRHAATDLRLAVLDFAGGALLPAEALPHCIGMSMEELDAAEEVVLGLERELAARRELFAARGWPDLRAQRAQSDRPLPWLVLVIDGWDNLAEEGVRQGLPTRIAGLLARGGPQGLQVVMSGDRGTTHSQIARHLTHRYSLRFNRTVDAELQGLMARDLPQHQPPGRAVEVPSGRVLQFAELDDPDGVGQGVAFQRALADLALHHHPADGGGAAATGLAAPPLSAGVALQPVLDEGPPEGLGLPLLVGVRDDPRRPLWADLEDSDGLFFVVGAPGTGRSTALRAMGRTAAAGGIDVVVIAPDGSPLADDDVLGGRRTRLEDAGGLVPATGRRLLVLVDDLDRLADGRPAQEALGTAVPGRGVVVAADIGWMAVRFSGLASAARLRRTGVVLSPASTANGVEMFGRSLDAALVRPPRPGRAVADLGDGAVLVQVPLP